MKATFSGGSIRRRIMLSYGAVLLVSLAVSVGASIYQMSGVVGTAEQRELKGHFENLKGAIAAQSSIAATLSALVANLPPAQEMFARGDRDGLTKLFLPAFKALKADYAVEQFQFHAPPATSFLRLHKPEKFGDDLSSFRQTVVDTNGKKAPTVGLEKGVAGLGVRGVVPVASGGVHVGSVEFGMSFGPAFFESFKKQFGVDAALYVQGKDGFKPFATTMGTVEIVGQAQLERAQKGTPVVFTTEMNGVPTSVFAGPVADFSGKTAGVAVIAADIRDYVDATNRSWETTLAIGAVILAIGLAVAGLIGHRLSDPIRRMTSAMDRLAEGDVDLDIPGIGNRDEIGEMAKAVQVFRDNKIETDRLAAERQREEEKRAARAKRIEDLCSGFDATSSTAVKAVAAAASQMQSSSEAMSATAEETTRQASAVAAASEQASANVQTVAAATEELSSSIAEISRQVSHASDIASAAVGEAQRANVKVQSLAEAADKIGEVVALITDIADQTNLLALNATIEAARAGEAGKGFAVVASEVKNLANQTARATEEIGAHISGIQAATQEAVTAIETIGKTITEIDEVNSGVAAAVEEQGAATQEIARNVEQAAAGTQDVSTNIAGVSQAANETGSAAMQIHTAADDLSRQSETLRTEVDRFLANVRAA